MAWPTWFSDSTAYQQTSCARTATGTKTRASTSSSGMPTISESRWTNTEHCTAKHSSAMVAAVRPRKIVESQVSHRQSRSRSTRGKSERKPHTPTYTPDRRSWISAYGVRGEAERAIQTQSPTLKAVSAAREPSQRVSFRLRGQAEMKPYCKDTVTMMQQICPYDRAEREQNQ